LYKEQAGGEGGSNSEGEYVGPLSPEGIAVSWDKGGYRYRGRNGELLSDERFEWASGFDKGNAWVRQSGSDYLVNAGISRVAGPFAEHWSFADDIARVQYQDGKYAYVRRDGKILGESRFDFGSDFYMGFAVVRKGSLEGRLDLEGRLEVETDGGTEIKEDY